MRLVKHIRNFTFMISIRCSTHSHLLVLDMNLFLGTGRNSSYFNSSIRKRTGHFAAIVPTDTCKIHKYRLRRGLGKADGL